VRLLRGAASGRQTRLSATRRCVKEANRCRSTEFKVSTSALHGKDRYTHTHRTCGIYCIYEARLSVRTLPSPQIARVVGPRCFGTPSSTTQEIPYKRVSGRGLTSRNQERHVSKVLPKNLYATSRHGAYRKFCKSYLGQGPFETAAVSPILPSTCSRGWLWNRARWALGNHFTCKL